MIELKSYQESAVEALKSKMVELLNLDKARQKLVFKAPTGSGKTVMASVLLDALVKELPTNGECKYTDIAFIWIAPNKLHQQSYLSMRNFFTEVRNLNPVLFDDVDTNEGLNHGDVLFLNWESINKDNAVIIRDNEMNRNLAQLVRNTQIEKAIPIVVVIDEEHMFGGRNAKKSEKVLQSINPKVELRISATPETLTYNAVEIPRQLVIEEEMIKKGIELNPQLKNNPNPTLTLNQHLLKKALTKRNDLARAYKAVGSEINPLLLIQLPNDTKDSLTDLEKKIVDEVKQYLDVYENINIDNGKLAVWLSNEKENLNDLEKPDNLTEVLLFKQAIALGWDCPRASVLLIYRDLKSITFTTQTVGRILRMPEQKFYSNDALNYGYVYTNLSADMIEIVGDDMNYLSKIFSVMREGLHNVELPSVYQFNNKVRNRLGSDYKKVLLESVDELWRVEQKALFSVDDFLSDDEKDVQPAGKTDPDNEFGDNLLKLNKLGINTDISRIMVTIPKDLKIQGDAGITEIVDKARMALTVNEINAVFLSFLYKNVGSFAKHDSVPVLKVALLDMMEELFGKSETEAKKIILYKQNIGYFQDLIANSLARYQKLLDEKQARQRKYVYVNHQWIVPETRMFDIEKYNSCENEIFNNAMKPYFESRLVSKPEHDFARFIDKNNEYIDWWYKNGDSGKENFAVPYTDNKGINRCFYVDFIIRLKNGTICLFDTKSKGSDEDAPEKHNALIAYMNDLNKKGRNLVGGIVINEEYTENWYYSPFIIENTDDITNWSRLDFKLLNN